MDNLSEASRVEKLKDYALLLDKSAESSASIRRILMEHDATPELADQIMQWLEQAKRQPTKLKPGDELRRVRKQGTREFGVANMVVGLIIAAAGVTISVVTYNEAHTGQYYIVAYGPIAAGIGWFLAGLGRVIKGED